MHFKGLTTYCNNWTISECLILFIVCVCLLACGYFYFTNAFFKPPFLSANPIYMLNMCIHSFTYNLFCHSSCEKKHVCTLVIDKLIMTIRLCYYLRVSDNVVLGGWSLSTTADRLTEQKGSSSRQGNKTHTSAGPTKVS